LEYMACGVPVVGFDVGEMRGVVQAGAGIVAQDVPSFAAALISLGANPRQRMRMGELGKQAAAPNHWDILSEKYGMLLEHWSVHEK
jgi:glycosyltransferase involved in cell wall biosynthesis